MKEKRKAQFDHLDMLRTAVALAHSGEDIDTAARMWRQMGEDVPEQAVQYAKRIDPADLREMHHQQEVVAYGGIHVPLTSALDHPKLYEKEPRLKSTGFLTGKDPNEISTANYYPPRDEITLNPRFAYR